VSYVPSGSVLARLAEKHRPVDASSLLALGDPAFDRATPLVPPATGVMVKAVLPGSAAAKGGLRAGDVLLEYDGATLESPDDLKPAAKGETVKVLLWRDGERRTVRVDGGPLGAV